MNSTIDPQYKHIDNAWIIERLAELAAFEDVAPDQWSAEQIDHTTEFADFCIQMSKPDSQPDPLWNLAFLTDYRLFGRLRHMLQHVQSKLPPYAQQDDRWNEIEGDVEIALYHLEGHDKLAHVGHVDDYLAKLAFVRQQAAQVEVFSKLITHIVYHTYSEGYGAPDFMRLPKACVPDQFTAFVWMRLSRHYRTYEWEFLNKPVRRDEAVVNLWLYPEQSGYQFKPLVGEQILSQLGIAEVVTQRLIADPNPLISQRKPLFYGAFVDGKRIFDNFALNDLGLLPVLSGIGFELEWNDVQIFYETGDAYVYYTWGTGA